MKSLRFQSIISRKGAELGDSYYSININRTACMSSPLVQLHLTLLSLKGQCQTHSDFEGLYLVMEPSIYHCLAFIATQNDFSNILSLGASYKKLRCGANNPEMTLNVARSKVHHM